MAPFLILLKALGEGERWITVRPHGPGTEGQPVLIKPSPDGAYHVIGGAGGSLNNLKLTGIKKEGEYSKELAERAQSRKEELKRRAASDREHGLSQGKAAIREGIKAQVGDQAYKFIRQVSQALGWSEDKTRFPEEKYANVSEAARKKATEQHGNALLKAAVEAVEFQRKRLLVDSEARQEAGLGEVKMTAAKPEDISVQDLSPIAPETKGFGFAPEYSKRAEAQGSTKADIAEEAVASKPPVDEKKAIAAEKRKVTGEAVAKELKDLQEPLPLDKAQMLDAKQAVELLKAEKQFVEVRKKARAKLKTLTEATTIEPKAYLLEQAGPVDPKVLAAGLDSDLRTLRTRGFLNEVGKVGPDESLGRSIGVGAYSAVNALALAAGGASLMDRSVVDVLGVAGAAQVLVRRLRADLTGDDMDQITEAMGTFHVDRYMALSDESLRAAREWHEMANEIELGEAENGNDLAIAQEMNAKRREFIGNANRVLGTALGEMEANAAMVVALGQPTKKRVQVSLGKTSLSSAITQVRALGLDKGEYTVSEAGGNTVLTIAEPGLDKLASPIARADLVATRVALDIIDGKQDEDNWLPKGVADRPDLAMDLPAGVAPQLAKPFKVASGGVGQAVADYIGGRTADGDSPADIIKGLLSEDTMQAAGDREAFISAVNAVAPLYGSDGRMTRVETYADKFNELADDYVARTYGANRTPIQRQQFPVDRKSIDALHRALAAHPAGVAAFKPIGDLTAQDQSALRSIFTEQYGRLDPKAEALRQSVAALDKQEPAKEAEGLFGSGPNPEWARWKTERDQAAEAANAATMDWGKYVKALGSPTAAYEAMADVVRGNVIGEFAAAHNKLRPDAPLKLGRQVISHDIAHLDALDPAAREKRLETSRALIDSLRNRVAGRYSSGSVADKMEAARAADVAASQAQMGLFGEAEDTGPAPPRPLELGERHSIGHEAERQVAGMMSVVGKNFRPGQPIKLWKPTMSGAYVGRQRAVKLIQHNKRTMLGMGVGSGKTSIMLSAFTDLKSKGQAHRGMFLVPSVVQGQFHGEALTMLEPGKFSWHADPSADRAARIAKYKDPKNDFSVVTHQAFRDDLLHMAAGSEGSTPAAVAEKLDKMSGDERKSYIKSVLDKEGINFDYLAVDEGHNLLNRAGKQNSHMANVVDAVSGNTPYYVNSTADPVKNDASEAYDVMHKLRPDKYADRDAFMRKYGVDTAASREGLRREMARSFYTGKIDPGVQANKRTITVDVSAQRDTLDALDKAAGAARLARLRGQVDVAAMKTLSPSSFASAPAGMHEEIARALQGNLGIIHNTAVQHAISDGAKVEALAKVAAEHKGKPGVVFIHSLQRVKEAAARLEQEGHRVVTLTGADSSAEKDRKKRDYKAGKYDVMVASDAAAVGANLQSGKWLVQFDTPNTAMLHAQRNGRIHRIGQTEDVDLIDLVADHPSEVKARKRLETKYGLREVLTSPLEGLDETGVASYLNQARAGTLKPGSFSPTDADLEAEAVQPARQQAMF
jgi:hypothetical protein